MDSNLIGTIMALIKAVPTSAAERAEAAATRAEAAAGTAEEHAYAITVTSKTLNITDEVE